MTETLINLGIVIIYLISATFVSLVIAMAIWQDREVKRVKQELNNLKQWQGKE